MHHFKFARNAEGTVLVFSKSRHEEEWRPPQGIPILTQTVSREEAAQEILPATRCKFENGAGAAKQV